MNIKIFFKFLFLQIIIYFSIISISFAAMISYSYDSAGRLTHADHGSGKTIAYTYDNNGNLLQKIVGKGSKIDISVNKTEIDFGNVKINTAFESTIIIKNEGDGNLIISETKIIPDTGTDANEFSINNNYNQFIKPMDNTLISITFKPGVEGAKRAILNITSNDPDKKVIAVILKGTGIKETSVSIQTAAKKSKKGGLCVISLFLNKKWIKILNGFKDEYLILSPQIKKIVNSYYKYSPAVGSK
ncbi:choice-of-anchor D domain-containing protein [Candidatus Desantisbacteria bacterium]|nr:choice-of-anchor D domain-containing protein [Candidatus Desantisbacteria bacterium]